MKKYEVSGSRGRGERENKVKFGAALLPFNFFH